MSKIKTMLKKNVYFILFGLLIITINSCDRNEVYYKFHEVKNFEWSKFDTLYFEIDSSLILPNQNYNISIELIHNNNYPYRNIWLYGQDNIDNKVEQNYAQQYMLADEYGKWEGSGFGGVYQISLNYRPEVKFKDNRNYIIKLIHGMRDEPLKGIEKVGIKIEKE